MSREEDFVATPTDRAIDELGEALANAYAPTELDPEVNERLIRAALEDPLAEASDNEVRESERLRRALQGELDHPDLDLVRSLALAHRGKQEPGQETRQIVDRATREALARPKSKGHGTLIYVTFAGVLAAAAATLLFVEAPHQSSASRSPSAAPASATGQALARSRSSEALFKRGFGRGTTSQRIDRIASARAKDLRANRFRQWGVP